MPPAVAARRSTTVRLVAVLACALASLLVLQSGTAQASTSLNGDGSSWSGPALDQWRDDIAPQGIDINFSPSGSAAGRQQWELGQADFAASDVPFRTRQDTGASGSAAGDAGAENPVFGFSYVPVTAGGTAFMYHVTVGGKKVTNLRLSPETIVKIFTNKITMWDDPAIEHDYGGSLPHEPITPVVRSDGSGATAQFTRWMEHTHGSEWDAYCRSVNGTTCGDYTEFFPPSGRMRSQNGSDVVASYIMSPTGEGSIGYDEYAYALHNNWPVVKVLNPAGYFSLPSASDVAVALTAAKIRGVDDNTSPNDPNYLQQNLDGVYTNNDPRSYPISSYSYLIVPRSGAPLPVPPRFNTAKGSALSKYSAYILCGGQGEAAGLGYSPIPRNLVRGGMLQVNHIPGADTGVDPNRLNNCPNPTFNAQGQLTVLVTAPQPSPCDKLGAPLNCTVHNGKAVSTGGSGSAASGGGAGGAGGSGGAGGASGGASGGGAGGASGGTGSGGTGAIDPETGLPVGQGGGGTGGSLPGSVVNLAERRDDWMMTTLTAMELVAAVAVPPVLGSWIARPKRAAAAGGPRPGPRG